MMRDEGMKPLDSGTESQTSPDACEWYHVVLQQCFQVIRMNNQRIPVYTFLVLAVRAMNEKAGPAAVSPRSQMLEVKPRMPVKPTARPEHRERFTAISKARAVTVNTAAQERSSVSFLQGVPSALGQKIDPEKRVWVYRGIPEN